MNLLHYYREIRFACLLLLLLLALAAQQCNKQLLGRAVCSISSPVPAVQAAGLPGGLTWRPVRVYSLRLPALRDTSRGGGAASLQRKALPRCRWQGAYLVFPLPRRPKQAALDSAARHPKP